MCKTSNSYARDIDCFSKLPPRVPLKDYIYYEKKKIHPSRKQITLRRGPPPRQRWWWWWKEFMWRKDFYDSRVCFKKPGIHGRPPQCWHDNRKTAETDDTESLTAYKRLAEVEFLCLKACVCMCERKSPLCLSRYEIQQFGHIFSCDSISSDGMIKTLMWGWLLDLRAVLL